MYKNVIMYIHEMWWALIVQWIYLYWSISSKRIGENESWSLIICILKDFEKFNQNDLNIYSLLYPVLCHSILESLVEFLKGIYLLPLLCKTLLTRLSFCFVCLNFKLSSLIVTIWLCVLMLLWTWMKTWDLIHHQILLHFNAYTVCV